MSEKKCLLQDAKAQSVFNLFLFCATNSSKANLLHLLSYKTKQSSKLLHLRSWNQWMPCLFPLKTKTWPTLLMLAIFGTWCAIGSAVIHRNNDIEEEENFQLTHMLHQCVSEWISKLMLQLNDCLSPWFN